MPVIGKIESLWRYPVTARDGTAGLYAAVLVEGIVRPGDAIAVVA